MNFYQVLILTLKNRQHPKIFEFVTAEKPDSLEKFKSYYKEILNDHAINKDDVLGVCLHYVQKQGKKKYQYVIICETDGNPVTYDYDSDEVITSEQVVESGVIENVKGVYVHQVRQNMFTRKL
jgi:hypothetical protein